MKLHIKIWKYHLWYLCQISLHYKSCYYLHNIFVCCLSEKHLYRYKKKNTFSAIKEKVISSQPCGKPEDISACNRGRFVTSLSLLSIQHGEQQTDCVVDQIVSTHYKNHPTTKKDRKYQQKNLYWWLPLEHRKCFPKNTQKPGGEMAKVAGSMVESSCRSSLVAGF